MLIRSKLLLLALVPLPVLMALAGLSLATAQDQYRVAQQLAEAMDVVQHAGEVARAAIARRDADAAALGAQSRGLESLLEGDTGPAAAAPEAAAPAGAPQLDAAAAALKAVPLEGLPEAVRDGARAVNAYLDELQKHPHGGAEAADVLQVVVGYDHLIRATSVLPQLLIVGAPSAHARELQTVALLLRLQDLVARERIYMRHAVVTNAIQPALAREFTANSGIVEFERQLFDEVFADEERRQGLQQALARARAAGRDPVLQQIQSFAEREDKLGLLKEAIGYGGMIHAFKNYLLRGEPRYRGIFEARATAAAGVVEEIIASGSLSDAERADARLIADAIAGYRARISQVATLRAQGTSIQAIDAKVRFGDEPVLAAITHLGTFRPQFDARSLDAVEVRLLADLTVLTDGLVAQLQEELTADRAARARQRTLLMLGLAATLLLMGTLTFVLYRRMAGGIRALVQEFRRIGATGDVAPRTVVEGTDELAQLNEGLKVFGHRLEALAGAAERIAAGDIETVFEPLGREDRMANAVLKLTHSARGVAAQAQAISAGNYATVVEPRSDKDTMTFALADMAQALRHLREENEQAQWLSGAQLQVLGAMGNADLPEALGGRALVALSSLTGAPLGLVYLLRDESLVAVASHGTSDIQVAQRQAPADGLVGRAMKATHTELFTKMPAGYLKLRSGLGQGDVAALTLTPLRARGQAVGVLELGWFAAPDPRLLALLDSIVESLGLALLASEARRHTELLLDETRRQAARLSEQQEELRQTNEELEEQAQLLRQSEEELKSQREELQAGNEELQEKSNLLLRQREQLEKTARDLQLATRYKSEFLANMSHELRTPLNSLLILSRSLMGNEEGNLTPDQLQSARIIHEGGRDLLNLINDILDLSKVEAGKLDIHLVPFPLTAMVDSLRRQFEPVASDRKLKLEFEIAPDVPAEIVSDRQRVEQILRNLLSNALKFTEKGTVALRISPAAARHAAGEEDGPLLAFLVEDTGIGIPAEKLDLIFQAFQQADGSTSRKYGGTGLGLTIARQLAGLLGGAVRVASIQGQGSKFTLVLPERKEQPMAPSRAEAAAAEIDQSTRPEVLGAATLPPAATDPPVVDDDRGALNAGDRCMLIIDDDLKFAGVMRDVVRKRGFKAIVAGDGASGLRLARRYLPSAILLDMRLPDMEGRRVLDELKWSPVTRHIPVHVVSAMDPSNEPLKQGAIGFLHKPAELTDLQQVVDRIDATLARDTRTVLVVEDDRRSQAAVRSLLQNSRTTVVEAITAENAMKVLREQPVDCIVLDLSLPDTDGFQFLEELRRTEEGAHPPVVVYTGRELSTDEHRRLAELAQSVVIKGAASPDRLLDDVLLFLHAVEADLPEPQKQVVARLHSGADAFEGKKLLIVDDDLRNVFALSGLLKKRGLEVLVADNGEMALQKLNENPAIDAVLMDVMMPVMDGLETTRRLRADPRFARLPIIAVTAKAMAEDRRRCMDAGVSDYLSKPVELDALLAMLRVWLSRHA